MNVFEKKQLLLNTISLSALHATNYILPFITFPYLIRILGIEYFGLLSFATIIIAYLNVIVDYGFNLTATKNISIHRDNQKKIIEIFSSVMIIKSILLFLVFFLLLLLLHFIPKLSSYSEIYIFTFGNIIGQVLFPIWFFQGMENMKYITYLNIISKIFLIISIFIFIKEENDFWIVPIITSVISIIIGLLSLIFIKNKYNIWVHLQEKNIIIFYLRDGWNIFTANLMSNFYKNLNTLILGILTNNIYVGYYTIAEKIVKVIQILQNIPGNVLYPYMSKKTSEDNKYFLHFDSRYKIFIIGFFLITTVFLYLTANTIVYIIYGEYQQQIVYNVKVMSLLILTGGLNYYYGILGLVIMNYKKEFSKYIIIVSVINIFLSLLFIEFLNDIGASISLVLSECILLILIFTKIHKINIGINYDKP